MKENYTDENLKKYQAAENYLKSIIDDIDKSLTVTNGNDKVIDHSTTRIKEYGSAMKKLERKGYVPDEENINLYLNDIIGGRIICPFYCGIGNTLKEIRKKYKDIIIDEEDYASSPKPSGYSSYHITADLSNGNSEKVTGEIQIRTMAMDLWASLDHILRYKMSDEIRELLDDSLTATSLELRSLDFALESLKVDVKGKIIEYNSKNVCDVEDNKIKSFDLNEEDYASIYDDYGEAKEYLDVLIKHFFPNKNLVDHVKSRVKKIDKAALKLEKKGYDVSPESMKKNLNDGLGFRIICPFRSDIEKIVSIFHFIPGIEIINEKDYVKNPKESCYSGYHLDVLVSLPTGKKVRTEIQVRTMAMDLWATVDRELRLKAPVKVQRELDDDFKRLADKMTAFDKKMDMIKNFVDGYSPNTNDNSNHKKLILK